MKELILTLGHGSSAILIEDGVIINGYANERISRIKSDSQWPIHAIEEIAKWDDISEVKNVYISHWDPLADYHNLAAKYVDLVWLEDYNVISLNKDFTHHDSHAYSALAYHDFTPAPFHIIVADGFGSYGEVLSIYHVDNGPVKLVKRVYGYNNSLGLLYQYATDYVGMKMNQDEWRLNAYGNVASEKAETLSYELAATMLGRHYRDHALNEDDPVINLSALSFTHKYVHDLLSKHFEPTDLAGIARFLQCTIEKVIIHYVDNFDMDCVLLVGGCFMNVQLNGFIARHIAGLISIMPLSGDCGAGLGVYKFHNPDFLIPDDLCWGKRKFGEVDVMDIALALENNQIVNVVVGKMEFGERAYGNTSTLAMPTKENAVYINYLNSRDISMPMCPIMCRYQYEALFIDTEKVIRSEKHMIIALEYINGMNGVVDGVSHRTFDGSYSGRPQVIDEGHYLFETVREFGPLINTSFNNHGKPIVYDLNDIFEAYHFMLDRDVEGRVTLFTG